MHTIPARPCDCSHRIGQLTPTLCDGFQPGCNHPGLSRNPAEFVKAALNNLIAVAELRVPRVSPVWEKDAIEHAHIALRYLNEFNGL